MIMMNFDATPEMSTTTTPKRKQSQRGEVQFVEPYASSAAEESTSSTPRSLQSFSKRKGSVATLAVMHQHAQQELMKSQGHRLSTLGRQRQEMVDMVPPEHGYNLTHWIESISSGTSLSEGARRVHSPGKGEKRVSSAGVLEVLSKYRPGTELNAAMTYTSPPSGISESVSLIPEPSRHSNPLNKMMIATNNKDTKGIAVRKVVPITSDDAMIVQPIVSGKVDYKLLLSQQGDMLERTREMDAKYIELIKHFDEVQYNVQRKFSMLIRGLGTDQEN